MKVSTFKRCRCRDDAGRELGKRCPQMHRADGSLNPRHGSWSWRIEMPTDSTTEKRRVIKRGAHRTEGEALAQGKAVVELLAIPAPGDLGAQDRAQIMTLVDEALKRRAPLPAAEDIRRRVRTGQPIASRVTVAEFLDGWLAGKKDIRPTTWAGYESNIRIYLKPALGPIEMDKLRVQHVSAMFDDIDDFNDRLAEVRANGTAEERRALRYRKPVGPATKQRIRATLRSALTDAMNEQLITANVAKFVKLASGKRPKGLIWTRERVARWREIRALIAAKEAERAEAIANRDRAAVVQLADEIAALEERERPSPVMVWTAAHTGAFLDSITEHRLYALFHLVTFVGLRRGEACGLRWVDLDLDDGVATIAEQLFSAAGKVGVGRPKSDAGDRDVALDKATCLVLKAHRKQQREDRLKWGAAWVDSGRVFTREDGSELNPPWLTDLFGDLVAVAGLPPIRLHDLRHGAATLAKAAGIDTKVISEMLGHSSRKITDDTYGHVFAEVAREAAEATAAIVPRKAAAGGHGGPGGLRLVSDSGA
ncbi:tyrosine-type recombinase/integrase [Dactylosporangium maewongense]|uniref:Tyrosine-type recombinase/integrase n=1 Tax=Dactylosporangium maewongense TaxID=634393 RepID=A0ABN2C2P4_9ACTN